MSGASSALIPVLYLVSAVLFIFGLKGLTRIKTARRGNLLAASAMLVAIAATLIDLEVINFKWIILGVLIGGGIGAIAAVRVPMTAMPEMVALFNGCGGASSALIAMSLIWSSTIEPGKPTNLAASVGAASAVTSVLSVLIGALTASGSIIAFLKLKGTIKGQPIILPGRHLINAVLLLGGLGLGAYFAFFTTDLATITLGAAILTGASLLLGILLVIPIGGADMPVVISLLNSYSGIAASAAGFVLNNNVLIISGALVGASGLILTQIMCKAMNRTLGNVLFGGFGGETDAGKGEYTNVRSYSAEEAALILESAESVIVVPGYGLAVAQAQHTVREMANLLESNGSKVSYAIHPVAGRMPGHMNVLLAEADVPYEQLIEMERINPEFKNTDVVLIVGANDVVNPAAETTQGSPIYGMPVLKVWDARTTIVIKRSLSAGFAGIKNDLFDYDNNVMIFGDGKQVLQDLVSELKEALKG